MRLNLILPAVSLGFSAAVLAIASAQGAPLPRGPAAPALWSATADSTPPKTVYICADASIRTSFTRPLPNIGGVPCVMNRPPVETANSFRARCSANDVEFFARSSVTGDLARDFTVRTYVKRHDKDTPDAQQVRRYRHIGPCPAGWDVGDQAAAGDTQVENVLSHRTRPLGAPFRPPA